MPRAITDISGLAKKSVRTTIETITIAASTALQHSVGTPSSRSQSKYVMMGTLSTMTAAGETALANPTAETA